MRYGIFVYFCGEASVCSPYMYIFIPADAPSLPHFQCSGYRSYHIISDIEKNQGIVHFLCFINFNHGIAKVSGFSPSSRSGPAEQAPKSPSYRCSPSPRKLRSLLLNVRALPLPPPNHLQPTTMFVSLPSLLPLSPLPSPIPTTHANAPSPLP